MDIKGIVHEISPVIQVSEKFKKRELIIEYAENPQYKEYIKFEAQQDKVDMFDSLKVGNEVEVFFNLRGKPFTNKEGITVYFNNMICWRVSVLSATSEKMAPVDINVPAGEDDDLPFG